MGRGILTDDQVILITEQMRDAFLHGVTPRQTDLAAAVDELSLSGQGQVFGPTNIRKLRAISIWGLSLTQELVGPVPRATQVNSIRWGTNSGSMQVAFAIINPQAIGDLNLFGNLFVGSPNISQFLDVDVQALANNTQLLDYKPGEVIIPKDSSLFAYNVTTNGTPNVFFTVRASDR